MKSELESWAQLVLLLGKYRRDGRRDNEVASDAAALKRKAESLSRLAVEACNRGLTEREERRVEAMQDRLASIVINGYEGVRLRFGGDPRGYVVALVCRDGEHNSWGGAESGWGIG